MGRRAGGWVSTCVRVADGERTKPACAAAGGCWWWRSLLWLRQLLLLLLLLLRPPPPPSPPLLPLMLGALLRTCPALAAVDKEEIPRVVVAPVRERYLQRGGGGVARHNSERSQADGRQTRGALEHESRDLAAR